MKFWSVNELREMFLEFFEGKGHLRLPSASLVPQNDPSLLLINSGMAPLKAYFTGAVTPPSKRVTTCQKCIRTPDIERVGKTARHGTYFEMLGNFSFGDYFKKDATKWAWEFVTEMVGIPIDKLYVTIYEEDDEAEEIWAEHVGVARDRIVRLGKEDNFWEHGTGPCGPCSEIYYDRGEEYGCGSPTCAVGCDCDRYVEFWNLVFTQFNKDDEGHYTPLPKPNIDTGMGLERLAVICQGVDNLFEIDTVSDIINAIAKRAGIEYKKNEKNDVSLRVIADHIRGTTFMIGDGVTPSNEGRGYVLRRLLRRAARHGRLLGIEDAFLADIAKVVIKCNEKAYPELKEKENYILKVISMEEERFDQTIVQGENFLRDHIEMIRSKGKAIMDIGGDIVFKLYDTFGFPFELTQEIIETEDRNQIPKEEDIIAFEDHIARQKERFDKMRDKFESLMNEQRERARKARVQDSSWENHPAPSGHPSAEGNFPNIAQEESEAHARAHSATHLLQAALRKVLGDHVFQKGSFVGEDRLRFDFSHFEAMTEKELAAVEDEVNKNILRAMQSDIKIVPIAEARKMGAMALFGEKYGNEVRVVKLGDASIEFCSGRHVENTGNIGLFHINSESGSAAGVRRIDASVGLGVLELLANLGVELQKEKAKAQEEIKELHKEIKKIKASNFEAPKEITKEINGIFVSILKLDTSDVDVLKQVADNVKVKNLTSVVAVGGVDENGVKFVVAATEEAARKGAHAGNIVREIAEVAGGRGGGKTTFAQAGAEDGSKVDEALERVFEIVK